MPWRERSGAGGGAKPGPRHRLFFALLPDDTTREQLHRVASRMKATHRVDGRWVNPRRYHLTLQFLGEFDGLPAALAAQACAAAASVRAAAFTMALDRAGSFRNRFIPWWLGPGAEVPELDALWHGLGTALARAGVVVPDAKAFRPHVTVLRDAGAELSGTDIAPPVTWRVEAFHLMHSDPGAPGAYTSLGDWPLGA